MTILRGLIVGVLAGLLVGLYVYILSADYVIPRPDYLTSLEYEEAQSRYRAVILAAFSLVLAAIGPVVAVASFGAWIRHAVYGLVGGVGFVLVASLLCAALWDQQPFNPTKTADTTAIDMARVYLVPFAAVVGPVCGILIGRLWYSAPYRKPIHSSGGA